MKTPETLQYPSCRFEIFIGNSKIYPTNKHNSTLLPTLLDALYLVKRFLLTNPEFLNEVKDLEMQRHHATEANHQIKQSLRGHTASTILCKHMYLYKIKYFAFESCRIQPAGIQTIRKRQRGKDIAATDIASVRVRKEKASR